MSRTKRFIPYNCRSVQPWEWGWVGINYKHIEDVTGTDPRNALERGYDGISQSYYYCNFPGRGWRENYQGDTRKYFKRHYNKAKRRYFKINMEEWEE